MAIYQLLLIEQKQVANQTIEFIFDKPDNFKFTPGQYGGFTLIDQKTNTPITRRFSLLSSPEENVIRITTRVQESNFKNALLALKPKDTIKFAGPTGTFVLHHDVTVPAVLIAGGIGITPFYSMIQHLQQTQITRPIVLFYGNNTIADAAYFQELTALAQQQPSFTFIPILQNPSPDWQGEKGFITASLIDNYFDCSKPAVFYVCGSPAMVQAMQRVLVELEIHVDNVKVEDFPGY